MSDTDMPPRRSWSWPFGAPENDWEPFSQERDARDTRDPQRLGESLTELSRATGLKMSEAYDKFL
jgi:hypothetical protein